MALTQRQINKIINKIEANIDDFEGAVFFFGDVQVKVTAPVIKDSSVSVKIKVTANVDDQASVEQALNFFNEEIDGPAGRRNPAITFDDDTPDTAGTITDTFRLTYKEGSGFDFADI